MPGVADNFKINCYPLQLIRAGGFRAGISTLEQPSNERQLQEKPRTIDFHPAAALTAGGTFRCGFSGVCSPAANQCRSQQTCRRQRAAQASMHPCFHNTSSGQEKGDRQEPRDIPPTKVFGKTHSVTPDTVFDNFCGDCETKRGLQGYDGRGLGIVLSMGFFAGFLSLRTLT